MNHKIRVKWFFNNLVSTFIYLTIYSKLTSEFLLLYQSHLMIKLIGINSFPSFYFLVSHIIHCYFNI